MKESLLGFPRNFEPKLLPTISPSLQKTLKILMASVAGAGQLKHAFDKGGLEMKLVDTQICKVILLLHLRKCSLKSLLLPRNLLILTSYSICWLSCVLSSNSMPKQFQQKKLLTRVRSSVLQDALHPFLQRCKETVGNN